MFCSGWLISQHSHHYRISRRDKSADWIIDLGPEGGEGGGRIVAEGSPEAVARNRKSYTGQALRSVLNGNGIKNLSPRKRHEL